MTKGHSGLCDLLPEPALEADADGVIRGWNAPAATLFGDLSGRSVAGLLEHGDQIWTALRDASADGVPTAEGVLPGGRRCRLRATSTPTGGLLVALTPDPDVHDLRHAFEHLHAALQRFGIPDVPAEHGLVLVGPDGTVEYASRLLHELGGESPVGKPFAAVMRRLSAPTESPDARVELVGVDGAPRTLDHFRVALTQAPGQAGAVLHVFRDVTAMLARDRQLHERDQRLENARAVLNRGQHLRALGELAGEVAHEFGNVLQAIGLHAAVLRRQPDLAEGVTRSLASIKHAVDTGHAFTRRLLTFARDDGGRMEPIDVSSVLRDVAQIIEPRIAHEKRPIQLALSVPSLPEYHGSRGKLSETFLNVFLNALEAMPEGGTLEVTAAASGGEVRIAIRDSGVGMSEDAERHAFDPFFTTKVEHAGLGLSTVWGIVRSHGGSVFIETEDGKGTAVCMAFPTAEPPAIAAVGPSPKEAPRSARVLVVDDHPAVREATAELLSGQGYVVARAGNVAEALAALERERFGVVVTDVGLPDRPGWDIARAVKERTPETLVVLVTGWGANVSPAQAKKRGADLLFEKPLDPDALLAAIARELDGVPGGGSRSAAGS